MPPTRAHPTSTGLKDKPTEHVRVTPRLHRSSHASRENDPARPPRRHHRGVPLRWQRTTIGKQNLRSTGAISQRRRDRRAAMPRKAVRSMPYPNPSNRNAKPVRSTQQRHWERHLRPVSGLTPPRCSPARLPANSHTDFSHRLHAAEQTTRVAPQIAERPHQPHPTNHWLTCPTDGIERRRRGSSGVHSPDRSFNCPTPVPRRVEPTTQKRRWTNLSLTFQNRDLKT